ncbi:MAG: hypothetical protein LBG92_07995 [Prevotellaceae bacterium]|jgi:hypothetical protein|nr:hypothetical protein [Prevotellaceae bacterium]
MTDGYADREMDLSRLTKIINNTDLSKNEIIKELNIEDYQIKNDTISLSFVNLIFKNEKLYTIINRY